MEDEGKYIYCVIEDDLKRNFGPLGIGDRGSELYTINYRDIAIVVSDSPLVKYPVSRENAMAHENAIEAVMRDHTVLPVRYGTIAESKEKIVKVMEREYGRFKNLLKKMHNKVELGLKVLFLEGTIYREILDRYESIKRLKGDIEKEAGLNPKGEALYRGIELGKMVESALENERVRYAGEILKELKGAFEDFRTNRILQDRMVLNAAFLVDRRREGEFDRRVEVLEERYKNRMKFKYVGGLPPFNFVNLVIHFYEG